MTTDKKPLAFLLAVTGNIAFAAGNVALSIVRHTRSTNYDIVIYHSRVSENDLAILARIPHVILRKFDIKQEFVDLFLKKLPSSSRFNDLNNLMTFCHFEVFDLTSEYSRVAWIDIDTSIQLDISSITSFAPFGITSDQPWTVGDNFSSPIPGFKMDVGSFCAAIMIVSDDLPYKDIYPWLWDSAVQFADKLKNPDQAIINIALQHFSIQPQIMPLAEWQCVPWRAEAHTARIVHFATEKKIWKSALMCSAFPEWYRTHLQWLELGGSDFDRSDFNVANVLPDIEKAKGRGLEDLKFGDLAGAALRKLSRKMR